VSRSSGVGSDVIRGALLAALLVCSGTGCASLSTLEEARALPKGHGRLVVSTSGAAGATSANPPLPNGAPAPLFVLDVGARVGLGSGTELGLRLSPMNGLRADFKVQFVAGALDLALDPTFTLHAIVWDERPRLRIEGHVPLLLGAAVGKRRWGYLGASVRGVVVRYAPITLATRFGKPVESAWTGFEVGAGFLATQGVGEHGRVRMMTGVDLRYDLLGGTGFKLAVQGGLMFDLRPVDKEERARKREERREKRRAKRAKKRGGQ